MTTVFELPIIENDPLEATIERGACKYAEKRGWWQRKFTSPGHRGVPDRIFGRGKTVFWIEFKRKDEPLRPQQEIEIKKMRDAGLTVYVCDNLADAKRVINVESM